MEAVEREIRALLQEPPAKKCRLTHQWTRWTEPLNSYQQRTCLRCGRIDMRHIYYG